MVQLNKFMSTYAVRLDRDALHFVATLLDPRGRCNRRGLFVLALALLGVQFGAGVLLSVVGLGLDTLVGMFVAALFLWIGFTAVSKRLHDIDASAWWFLGASVFWLVGVTVLSITFGFLLGADALAEGTRGYYILLALMMLPLLAAMLWLHLRPGQLAANRFGPAPRHSGFAMPHQTAKPAPMASALLA